MKLYKIKCRKFTPIFPKKSVLFFELTLFTCSLLFFSIISISCNLVSTKQTETTTFTSSPTTPILETALSIVTKTAAEIAKVQSYTLDSDVIATHAFPGFPEPSHEQSIEWKGAKFVNYAGGDLGMNMIVTDFVAGADLGASLEVYIQGDWQYLKTTAVGLTQPYPWTKQKLNNDFWERETQVPFLVRMLKNPAQFSSVSLESVNDISYYAVTVTPAVQPMIDFVISQEQPFGEQLDSAFGGVIPVTRLDAYQSGSVKMWISRDSYLPVKVEFDAHFRGSEGSKSNPLITGLDLVDLNVHGRLIFSNYNKSFSITVPQEAINTPQIAKPPSISYFPVRKEPAIAYMSALAAGGKLEIDNYGYVRYGGNGGMLIIWPYGYTYKNDGMDTWIINEKGQPVAKIGENIELGGGSVDADAVQILTGSALPKDAVGPYWITAPIEPGK